MTGAGSGGVGGRPGGGAGLDDLVAAADPQVAAHAAEGPGPGRFAGPVGDPRRALVLEAVYEGYLAHYRTPRAFAGMDPDMSLLAGDSLYALGLRLLAEAGDLEAVAELADLISGCARLEAEGRGAEVEALWEASAAALS